MTEDALARPFLGRTLATFAAVFSLLSTVVGAISACSANQAKEQAEATQAALVQNKATKDYQIQVFQMVDKSLTTDGGLVLAAAYVSSLDDRDLKGALAQALRTVGQARGDKLTQDERVALGLMTAAVRNTDAAPTTTVQSAASAKPQPAPPIASPLSNAGQASVLTLTSANPAGWDVDVFWCQSRGAASQALANKIGQAVAIESKKGDALGGQPIGRVRVRMLSSALEGQGYPIDTNEVRADAGEDLFADALGGLANGLTGDGSFKTIRSYSNTRWYVSLFACGA